MKRLSLRTKVFFLFAGAALLIVVPVLLLIAQSVERRVYERATADLEGAASALKRNWALRDSLLITEANARASAPGLASAWLAGDEDRMRRSLLRGLDRDRVALLADTAGAVLVGSPLAPEVLRDEKSLGSIVTVLSDSTKPVRVAIWPVYTDSGVIGVAGVGTKLGASTVADLKGDLAGGTDIALLVGEALVGTTFPDSLQDELAALDLGARLRLPGARQQQIAGKTYLSVTVPLPTRGLAASVLLFRPVTDELKLARGILSSMVGIGLAALLLALVLAGVVSRIVAKPAQTLAAAAADLARGNFTAPLPRPASDEIGQLAGAFAEMRAAIAEREARLRSAQAELIHREKLAAMGRLVAQLSHEINNPIYNIQNCLEALARRGDPNDPNREFLELAREELGRMATLTRQLLDQSRPLSKAATSLDLNALAERVVLLAERDIAARGVALELGLEPELPQVVAHADAVQQVLANLVANALDAMPGGGVLRVSTRADEEGVAVVMEDTGVGIAEEHLPHIFEAFYTTKPGVRGIGLGLFVSEGIIRGHRGRLSVERRAEGGSRFVVWLPKG